MAEFCPNLKKTAEFAEWYADLDEKLRARIDARLKRVTEGYFGNSRSLGDRLFELKWKNGLRVYYARIRLCGADIVLLLGGFKATQKRDLRRARELIRRCEHENQEGEDAPH